MMVNGDCNCSFGGCVMVMAMMVMISMVPLLEAQQSQRSVHFRRSKKEKLLSLTLDRLHVSNPLHSTSYLTCPAVCQL